MVGVYSLLFRSGRCRSGTGRRKNTTGREGGPLNKFYTQLLEREGLPKVIHDCATGKLPGQAVGMDGPAKWHVFPPALIPIWSEESGNETWGYWKHWFVDRPGTFVSFVPQVTVFCGEPWMLAKEIARAPLQFFGNALVQGLYFRSGTTPELRQFAKKVGITDLAPYERVTAKCYYGPLGFHALPGFETDLPLESVADVATYTGAFPTGLFFGDEPWWERACTTEFVLDDALPRWPKQVIRPAWLAKGRKRALFRQYLASGELGKAWLTLNSKGWSIPQAKDALAQLADAAGDDGFSLLARAWTEAADDSDTGY
jgi:hypothetical protein